MLSKGLTPDRLWTIYLYCGKHRRALHKWYGWT